MKCPNCSNELVYKGLSGSGSIYYCPKCHRKWVIGEVDNEMKETNVFKKLFESIERRVNEDQKEMIDLEVGDRYIDPDLGEVEVVHRFLRDGYAWITVRDKAGKETDVLLSDEEVELVEERRGIDKRKTDENKTGSKTVKIPVQLVVNIESKPYLEKITKVMIEIGHQVYLELEKKAIPEAFWREIWRQVELVEKRGQGQGVGGPRQGDGGATKCRCTKCGYTIDKLEMGLKGTPCKDIKCPRCDEYTMVGVSNESKGRKVIKEGKEYTFEIEDDTAMVYDEDGELVDEVDLNALAEQWIEDNLEGKGSFEIEGETAMVYDEDGELIDEVDLNALVELWIENNLK